MSHKIERPFFRALSSVEQPIETPEIVMVAGEVVPSTTRMYPEFSGSIIRKFNFSGVISKSPTYKETHTTTTTHSS
jgi:hypothetical protein